MKPIKLTAKQIEMLDEINGDKDGTKAVFDRAMQFYSNRINEIRKDEKNWWEELQNIYTLDMDKKYRIKRINGSVCVVLDD